MHTTTTAGVTLMFHPKQATTGQVVLWILGTMTVISAWVAVCPMYRFAGYLDEKSVDLYGVPYPGYLASSFFPPKLQRSSLDT